LAPEPIWEDALKQDAVGLNLYQHTRWNPVRAKDADGRDVEVAEQYKTLYENELKPTLNKEDREWLESLEKDKSKQVHIRPEVESPRRRYFVSDNQRAESRGARSFPRRSQEKAKQCDHDCHARGAQNKSWVPSWVPSWVSENVPGFKEEIDANANWDVMLDDERMKETQSDPRALLYHELFGHLQAQDQARPDTEKQAAERENKWRKENNLPPTPVPK